MHLNSEDGDGRTERAVPDADFEIVGNAETPHHVMQLA